MKRTYPILFTGLLALLLSASSLLTATSSAAKASALPQAAPMSEKMLVPLQNIKQIVIGGIHNCVLTTTGGVKCWGWNAIGQLGDGTVVPKPNPVDVVGLSKGVVAIATQNQGTHTCALLATGGVKCWGSNYYGQLGDGTMMSKTLPVDVFNLSSGVKAIAAGGGHSCALLETGGVKCWGWNSEGQLGDGTTVTKTVPVDVVGLSSGVTAITAGTRHTCALMQTGGVKCWGRNASGQLGDGTTISKTVPVDVNGLSSGVTAIVAGSYHTCALLQTGGVKCWGHNRFGGLGDGTAVDKASPVDVISLDSGVTALAGGYRNTCARMATGSIKCWGWDSYGQLGDGALVTKLSPVDLVGLGGEAAAVATGSYHTCAVLATGSVKCWGYNTFGQVGDGTFAHNPNPVDVVGLNGVAAVATGYEHTCALLTTGGVKCWGWNSGGQLGNGTTGYNPNPVDVVGLGSGVTAVMTGYFHTCAVLVTSSVKCWGWNDNGQLGDGTTISKTIPVSVSGLISGVKTLATGGYHNCALLTTGGVKCWGYNYAGALGDGTKVDKSSPVDVTGLSSGVTAIATGGYHNCALLTTGGVKCWGYNYFGQLGDGTFIDKPTPVLVTGLSNGVTAIAAGADHTCALLTTGGVKCWGNNYHGQLGDSSPTNRPTPVNVSDLSSGVTAITAGNAHTCALLTTNSVKCWGWNGLGQLGDGTTTDKFAPVTVAGLNGVANIATSYNHTCALMATGGVKCWGWDVGGQLGDGVTGYRPSPVDVLVTQPPVCYTLTAIPTGSGSAPVATPLNSSGCPLGQYVAGATVVLHASPAVQWRVAGWQGTVNDASTSADNGVIMPAGNATVTVTYVANPSGDLYESDDTCAAAHTLASDGVAQTHTFHQTGDVDWLRFEAKANVPYRITVNIPAGSPANVVLVMRNSCDGVPVEPDSKTFTPGLITTITRTVTSTVYLQLSNVVTTVAGADVAYQVAVRPLENRQGPHALILAAGSFSTPDHLQTNIDNVVKGVYAFYHTHGYSDDDIYFLTNQPLPGRDAAATLTNLQAAITNWAKSRLANDQTLTLYLMDHGDPGKFYLDGSTQQVLTAAALNKSLDELQSTLPELKITVIIEACYSGSFISGDNSISRGKAGRLVITSTNPQNFAYASANGAYFSDFFVTGLRQGHSLAESFQIAYGVTHELFGRGPEEQRQEPQLDANDNGIPNEPVDIILSTQFPPDYHEPPQTPNQAPYVASVTPPDTITNRHGLLQATVHDDGRVQRVWAVIKPPSFHPPTNSTELVPEALPTILLLEQRKLPATGDYAATFVTEYPGFDEIGLYQVAVYAEDDKGLVSNPKVIEVSTGHQLFLPLVSR